jgi:hypothetical protein
MQIECGDKEIIQQPEEHFLNNGMESCKSNGEKLCGFLGNSSRR